ncbi:hypothetical protein QU481_00750 [Crenobacter sp. SG2303]|uniref:DUF2188 domain-containing protein n=1 Tax=Crenobacter oryzisoli TaxID=3056844 RepID=A0ABT7XI17_9NEIS|nr:MULTISPECIES: hypothetical protein [unclassified Crenobacter]MDN0073428.1 hypothetical protein [Crenobacter sp. SG2303]MDN0083344.1 hypothetical protein [Crenobacter sp. SG2305]
MSHYRVERVLDPNGGFVGWAVVEAAQGKRKAGPYPFHTMAEDEAYRLSLRDEVSKRQPTSCEIDE